MNARARDLPLQRWPLVAQPSNRDESWTQDARIVNAHAEKDPNTGEWIVQKRIGYTLDYTVPGTATHGLGIYPFGQIWQDPSAYSIFSDSTQPGLTRKASMFKDGVLIGATNGLDGQYNYQYSFAEDNATPSRHLVFANLHHLYYLSTGTYTEATLPTVVAGITGPVFLDQTFYIMDAAGHIFNSGLNDPSTWTGSQVTANTIPGDGRGLATQLNYLLAFKANSMEVFYDAGNPPPASPLSPVPGATSNYGGISNTIQQIDNIVIFATSNRTVSPQVARLDNLQVSIISTPPVERMLDQLYGAFGPQTWVFKHGGHRFYGFTFLGAGTGGDYTLEPFTLVYDIDQNLWYQWTDPQGSYWPVVGMAYRAIIGVGRHVLQGMDDGTIYQFEGDYQYPTDNGVVAPVEITTPNADFGTRKRKILSKMYLNTDQTPGSILYVSRSDDDYKTWSIPRRVDLSKKRPELRQEGTFTRRAYKFRHMSPTPFRVRSVDLLMDRGVS